MAMDAVGKRILVAWLAIFLFGWFLSQIGQHAYNIYYALVAEKQLSHIRDWSLLLQWSSLFEIFLTGLYFARIPRIQFTSRQYLVLSAFLIGWQVCLFHSASPVSVRSLTERFYGWQTGSEDWASFSGAYSRVITSTGDAAAFERDRVRGAYTEDELMDEYASHIAGSVTVKVIPHSSAKFIVENGKMCIPLQRRQESGSQFPTFTPPPSEIPIQIAGVSPWTVEYSVLNYLNAEESVQSVVFYADDDYLFQEQLGAKFYTFALNATLPGQYKLIRLTDAKGEGAVADDTFEISICPEAFWNRFPLEDDVSLSDSVTPSVTATTAVIGKDLKLTIDKSPLKKTICRNEEAEVELMAFGVPPLSVSFVRRVGNLPPENVTVSHLEAGKSGNLPQLGTSKSFISKIKLGTFDTATEYRYYVTRVVDGRGVWTDYAQDFDADEFAVKVFERPEASLLCEGGKPIEVLTGEDEKTIISEAKLPVNIISKYGPFNLSYSIRPTSSGDTPVRRMITQHPSNRLELPVEALGEYQLEAVSDQHCKGTVTRHFCRIVPFHRPSIAIRSGLIETPCFGQIGFSFELQLTGLGPWTVKYLLKRDEGPSQSFTIIARKPTETIEIKPPNPGRYTVTFVEFADSHYPQSLPIPPSNVQSFTQSFHAPSFATLERYTRKLCVGDRIDMSVKLTGSGPWSLQYELISDLNRRQLFSFPRIESQLTEFQSPPLNTSGLYYVELKSVLDSNGCATPIASPAAQIEVFDSRPTASFIDNDGQATLLLIKGQSVDLNLMLTGLPPFTVEMSYKPFIDNAPQINNAPQIINDVPWKSLGTRQFSSATGAWQVKNSGLYKIVSVCDKFCSGAALGQNSLITVNLIPHPTAKISPVNSGLASDICVGDKSQALIKLTGKPPFILTYLDQLLSNDDDTRQTEDETRQTLTLAQSESLIDLNTVAHGKRQLTLVDVSDENYLNIPIDKPQIISQLINARPTAEFVKQQQLSNICHKQMLKPIEIHLTGKAPWNLGIQILFDTTSANAVKSASVNGGKKELSRFNLTVASSPFSFMPPENLDMSAVGRYLFLIEGVQDSNGCQTNYNTQATDYVKRQFSVQVSPEPKISLVTSAIEPSNTGLYSCVGDLLEYHLSGLAPWLLKYSFTDVNGTVFDRSMEISLGDDQTSRQSVLSFLSHPLKLGNKQQQQEQLLSAIDSRRLILRFSQPGRFSLQSICHGDNNPNPNDSDKRNWGCCKELTGMEHSIHPLPSVTVNSGQHSMDVIREGAEAVMTVELQGTPPFSFTYTRKSASGVELDSRSVLNVYDNRYTIPLNMEGTFQITSVADKFCKFPPKKNHHQRI